MEEYDQIIADIAKVMEKYGVEMVVRSEVTFVKINGEDKKPKQKDGRKNES